ncbi:C45 family autoproteolytic acyltransferase/hydolase [Ornithinibacillus scapharcae]|uniref:C45 family autoproteolytic acyltransferase/hydolase n=1 Tax=Ornithinibacillus scapharcae TaxID=1147159 RepID=UPI000225B676|nr:C45 family peptidase [Ornithinibacillus scapharcae]
MRKKLKVNIVELVGDNITIGIKLGKRIPFDKQFHLLRSLATNVDVNEATSVIKRYSTGLLDEIKGVATGLNMDMETAIKMYSGYHLTFPSMGCTAFADSYYVRNYDFSPELYDARVIFSKPTVGFASVGFGQQVVGRLDGMNEHGLVIGLHLVNQNHAQKGIIGTSIVRLVLERCRNTEEAIQLIADIPHSHCYNFSLLDREGHSCVIEATPVEQVVMKESEVMCTNHFETVRLTAYNRNDIGGSRQRKAHLQSFLSQSYTPEEAFKKFNHENSPLFYKNYHQYFGTLYTVVYIPDSLEVMVGIGGNAKAVKFPFKDWLEGSKLERHTIIGSIDY